jgi:predicted DNA-binding protein
VASAVPSLNMWRQKMAKPTTIRIPEDLLKEIDQLVQELKLDRSACLREIVSKGFSIDREERLLQKYVKSELNYMEVCRELGWNPWEFLDHLKAKNLHLNVDLEDWLHSGQMDMEKG